MKTIIYLRTSTQEQNPENQLRDCLSINKYGDYEITEEKQSAWKDKERLLFEEVKKKIKNKETNHLIVWDLDRIYRNRKKLIEFFQYCKIYSVMIHSFRQNWLEELNNIPQPFNEIMFNLMLNIMGWLAEEESNKKSERVKASIRKEDNITKSYKGKKWGRKALDFDLNKQILEEHQKGLTLREITQNVFYWDKSRNKKNVSLGYVHKIISENKQENLS